MIARLGDEIYHGNDAEQAIRGVLRKVKEAGQPRTQRVSAYALSVDAFVERYSRVKNVLVNVNDAR